MGWKFPYCPLSSHLLLNKVLLVFPDEIEFLPSSHILERRGFQDLTLANVRGKVRIIRQYKYSASDEVRITASVKGICGCDIDTFSGFSERNSALASLSVRTNTNYEPVISLTLFFFFDRHGNIPQLFAVSHGRNPAAFAVFHQSKTLIRVRLPLLDVCFSVPGFQIFIPDGHRTSNIRKQVQAHAHCYSRCMSK